MKWIKCKDALPIQKPEGWATYNWVIVTAERHGTGEPWPFSIAMYTSDGWELWDDDAKVPYAPCFGDTIDVLDADKITHWMEITKPMGDG